MRNVLFTVLLVLAACGTSGCFLPAYSGDPVRRVEELIWTSENLRNFADEWQRFWFLDMPDHETPWRTHGGII